MSPEFKEFVKEASEKMTDPKAYIPVTEDKLKWYHDELKPSWRFSNKKLKDAGVENFMCQGVPVVVDGSMDGDKIERLLIEQANENGF